MGIPVAPRTSLDRLLARLPGEGQDLEFDDLLTALRAVAFTGALTVDFHNGRPRQIHLGQPIRLAICHGGLDKPEGSRTR